MPQPDFDKLQVSLSKRLVLMEIRVIDHLVVGMKDALHLRSWGTSEFLPHSTERHQPEAVFDHFRIYAKSLAQCVVAWVVNHPGLDT
ncbi:hypothetical protein GPM19_07895 [Halomonas sp. ZH2S]|uniref:Uncharacterized protein n=1 Tax=Vreelandella zhuhanensis TaxID=2684210 RepID=A0A7X3KR87_9GAMM|nr:hypothetical protein [Halomonas zhuhanensis]MWJ28126.1 hypothetical protein [Halomonas zhuhanensis]